MFRLVDSKWWPWVPHVVIVVWLTFLAATIWQHALHSVQTPFGDALSYMQKAVSFWQAVEKGVLFNPFNLEPSVRPPGTVLMSYPFGFSSDFHGFYFRSVYLPILSLVAAVYVAAGNARLKISGWWVASVAMMFSSLPLFYWFDWNDARWLNNGWGMVDNFQAGISALAVAALVRSLMSRSLPWLICSALLASFTLLVKPSGLMVMLLIVLTWLMGVMFERAWARESSLSVFMSLRRYLVRGAVWISIIYILFICAGVFSDYLSGGNFAYAKQALAIWRKMAPLMSLQHPLQETFWLFQQSSGVAFGLWVVGIGILSVYCAAVMRKKFFMWQPIIWAMLVSAPIIWGLGILYWNVIQGGGNQVRYFYPFMLMGGISMVPAALQVWPYTNRPVRLLLLAVCILPAINIGGLLLAGNSPPFTWQKMTGVNVSVGSGREEVQQAYALLNEVRNANKDARVYFFPNGVPSHVFVFVGAYEKILNSESHGFIPVNPMNWARGFAVRIDELLDSDYVLVEKHEYHEDMRILSDRDLDSFAEESRAFNAFLFALGQNAGLDLVSDGLSLRLLRVVDRALLGAAIEQFVSARSWRPEFFKANPPVWWNEDSFVASGRKMATGGVDFGGIYMLHALAVNIIDKEIKVEVWWEEQRSEDANSQRAFFLHLVDSSGNILHNQQIPLYPYHPLSKDLKWRYGSVLFKDVLPDEKLASLAFGIYQSSGHFLLASKGNKDWDGRRVIIPINTYSAADVKIPALRQD